MDLLASFLKKQFEDNHQPDDHWKWSESCSVMPDSLQPHRLYSSWNSPGQNTGVCSLSLLQGSSQPRNWTQVSPYYRWILYQLSHKRSPRVLEWVAYLFSNGSSRPRNWTRVSCVAGGFFTSWVTREAPKGNSWAQEYMMDISFLM